MYIHGEFRDKDNNRIEVKILNGDRSEEMVYFSPMTLWPSSKRMMIPSTPS